MPELNAFSPPATIRDFVDPRYGAPNPAAQQRLDAAWNINLQGWVQQAILGDPWDQTYSSGQAWFYDPTRTDIPPNTPSAQHPWLAFPNRITQYLGQNQSPPNPYGLDSDDLYALADTGYQTDGTTSFPTIPPTDKLCPLDWTPDPNDPLIPYGPYGPRGWLDEYCEWSAYRVGDEPTGDIVRVDFVCENPEYWYTLWRIDPDRCAAIYQATLNYDIPSSQAWRRVTVTAADLQLRDPKTGAPVNDPSTGAPAYDPLNKWNNGPLAMRGGTQTGGAMTLTSTPNTLQTELGLAGGASVLRTIGSANQQDLICCGKYGQNYRNSDPSIGQFVNQAVQNSAVGEQAFTISLADPFGLYIQMPNFALWSFSAAAQAPDSKIPAGANVSELWHVVRGNVLLEDPITNDYFPGEDTADDPRRPPFGVGNFILHAVCQVPSAWVANGCTLTMSEILVISGAPLRWVSQIAQTFKIALYGRPIPSPAAPPQLPCVDTSKPNYAQPLQLMPQTLWDAYYATTEISPVAPTPTMQTQIPLASNTVITAAQVPAGSSTIALALTCSALASDVPPVVTFSTADGSAVDPAITAKVQSFAAVSYAVPGNSYPSRNTVLRIVLSVAASAAPGLRGVRIQNAGDPDVPFAPALLQVMPAVTGA